MIKNTNEILSYNVVKVEGILRNFVEEVVRKEREGRLNINSVEKMLPSFVIRC